MPNKETTGKTPQSVRVTSATLDTVTVDLNEIHNTVSIDRVTVYPYNAQGIDRTNQDSDCRSQVITRMKTELTKMTHA